MSTKKMILVVDDDDSVLGFLKMALSTNGFAVQVARDGVEGLQCFRELRHKLHLVLSDILMPGMNGMELALAIQAIDRDMPILLMSGYSDAQVEARSRRIFRFIRKPFRVEQILAAVRSTMRSQ